MKNNSHEKLIELHKIEKRLFEINSSRGNLPNKIDAINEKINKGKTTSNFCLILNNKDEVFIVFLKLIMQRYPL